MKCGYCKRDHPNAKKYGLIYSMAPLPLVGKDTIIVCPDCEDEFFTQIAENSDEVQIDDTVTSSSIEVIRPNSLGW